MSDKIEPKKSCCENSSTDICNWRPDYDLSTESARKWQQQSEKNRVQPFKENQDGTYTVEYGDSLWTVAERTLKAQGDGKPTTKEIKDEIQAYVDLNDDVYKSLACNPDYIRTGWKLKVPGAHQPPPEEVQPKPEPEVITPRPEDIYPPEPEHHRRHEPRERCHQPDNNYNYNYNYNDNRGGDIYIQNQGTITINNGVSGGYDNYPRCYDRCQPYYSQPQYYEEPRYYEQPRYYYQPQPQPRYDIEPPPVTWARPPEPGYRPRLYQDLPPNLPYSVQPNSYYRNYNRDW